jgi:hypothetical protein
MSIIKRIKTLWWMSGLNFGQYIAPPRAKSKIEKFVKQMKGTKMAEIVDMKDKEDLFPNQDENGETN